MKRISVLVLLIAALCVPDPAAADDGDVVRLALPAAQIGQQVSLRLEVVTPEGATVELDPGAAEWGQVAVVRIHSQEARPEGDQVRHVIVAIVAPFGRGALHFEPVVNVVSGIESTQRRMGPQVIEVLETLPADAPLELSPLPPPAGIGGAESPFLRPAIALGIVAAAALLAGLAFLSVRWLARRPRRVALDVEPRPLPDLAGAGAILESDPVAAYRTLSAAVRRHLAEVYGFPAAALTARELESRMAREGVDRWQARLVGGLLENCDAVVYAGYRPALERRHADLTMAVEIVEANAG